MSHINRFKELYVVERIQCMQIQNALAYIYFLLAHHRNQLNDNDVIMLIYAHYVYTARYLFIVNHPRNTLIVHSPQRLRRTIDLFDESSCYQFFKLRKSDVARLYTVLRLMPEYSLENRCLVSVIC
jgi:hypothetical protein